MKDNKTEDNKIILAKQNLYTAGKKINKHWVLKIILTFLFSLWFPIFVNVLGEYFHISNSDGLTEFGVWITVVLYLFAAFASVLSDYASKKDIEEQQKTHKKEAELNSNIALLDNLLSTTRNISGESLENVFKAFSLYCESSRDDLSKFMLDVPSYCLESISKEIRRCLHEISSVSCDRIAVSIAYKFKSDSDWCWGGRCSTDGGLSLSDLRTDYRTLFYRMANNQTTPPFVYIEDKGKAAKENQYVEDARDGKHRSVGSLIGLRIPIGDPDSPTATALVFISTYSKQISQSQSKEDLVNVEENLKLILSIFENPISNQILLKRFQEVYQKAEKCRVDEYNKRIEKMEKERLNAERRSLSAFGSPSCLDCISIDKSLLTYTPTIGSSPHTRVDLDTGKIIIDDKNFNI